MNWDGTCGISWCVIDDAIADGFEVWSDGWVAAESNDGSCRLSSSISWFLRISVLSAFKSARLRQVMFRSLSSGYSWDASWIVFINKLGNYSAVIHEIDFKSDVNTLDIWILPETCMWKPQWFYTATKQTHQTWLVILYAHCWFTAIPHLWLEIFFQLICSVKLTIMLTLGNYGALNWIYA